MGWTINVSIRRGHVKGYRAEGVSPLTDRDPRAWHPDRAARLIDASDADPVAIGQGQIANPDRAEKVRSGQAPEPSEFDAAVLAELV